MFFFFSKFLKQRFAKLEEEVTNALRERRLCYLLAHEYKKKLKLQNTFFFFLIYKICSIVFHNPFDQVLENSLLKIRIVAFYFLPFFCVKS